MRYFSSLLKSIYQVKDKSYDVAIAEYFRDDLAYVVELLTEVRRNGDPVERAILLHQMVTVLACDARSKTPRHNVPCRS